MENVKSALRSTDTEAEANPEAGSAKEVYPQTDKHRGRVTVHTPMHNRKGKRARTGEQHNWKRYYQMLAQAMSQRELRKSKLTTVRKEDKTRTSG